MARNLKINSITIYEKTNDTQNFIHDLKKNLKSDTWMKKCQKCTSNSIKIGLYVFDGKIFRKPVRKCSKKVFLAEAHKRFYGIRDSKIHVTNFLYFLK